MTASNVFSASSLSMSNGGRIVNATLWPVCFSNSVAMAFAAICVDPTLSTRTSAALARVDETMSVSPLTAMVRKNRRIVSSVNDAMVHCVRIYTRKPSATRSPLRGELHLSGDQSPPAWIDPDGGKLSDRAQGREHESVRRERPVEGKEFVGRFKRWRCTLSSAG